MPYIGNTIRAADDYRLIDDISSGFNGSATSFALQVAGSAPVPFPKSPQQVLISVGGTIQEPDPTGSSGFNLVGTNIVFSSAPTNGQAFFGIIYATADYLNAGGNFPSGSLGAPSFTFIGDENTGLYRKSGGSVGFVSDATEIANFDSNGITISSGSLIIPDSIIHGGDSDTKIRFGAANEFSVETAGVERFEITSTEVTFNDTGASVDFRVEGDTEPNLLFVDASADQVSIGTSSPSDVFDVVHAANAAAGISIRNTNNSQGSAIAQLLVSGGDSAKGRVKIETNGAFHTIDEDSNGNLIIEDNGTERVRLDSSGHILPGADSTYNIGANANRFANGYFDTLYGDGSNLTGVTSTTINNNANNRLITGSGTANTLEAESSFTYDGNGGLDMEGTGAAFFQIKTPNNVDGGVYFRTGSSNTGAISYLHTNNTMNFRVNSTNKLTINSDGDFLPGSDDSQDLGSSSKRWQNVFTTDLQLSNEGSQNDVDSTWGNYTIQEGHEDLFLINNRTGKKFKFNLTEVA